MGYCHFAKAAEVLAVGVYAIHQLVFGFHMLFANYHVFVELPSSLYCVGKNSQWNVLIMVLVPSV